MTTTRFTVALLALLATILAIPPGASAQPRPPAYTSHHLAALAAHRHHAPTGSIVFVKNGHVWLTSPDGRTRRRITATGGWSSPSQSDSGLIVAQKNRRFYRLSRHGRVLRGSVAPIGGAHGFNLRGFHIFGPYDPRVSPNGRRIAYWFRAQSVTRTNDIFTFSATTAVRQFDSSVARSAVDQQNPHWIGNTRLTTSDPYGTGRDAISTWVPKGDDRYRQGWFFINNVLANDGELSSDHTRFAISVARDGATSPYNLMTFWRTSGPAWTGSAPYSGREKPPSVPSFGCAIQVGADAQSPTWSPNSRRVAFNSAAGIYVVDLPSFSGARPCTHFRLIVAKGTSPDWGPASINAR